MHWHRLAEWSWWHNDLRTWGIALGIAMIVVVGLRLLRYLIGRRLTRLALLARGELDHLIGQLALGTRGFFILAVAIYTAAFVLTLPKMGRLVVQRGMILALLIQAAFWANSVLTHVMARYQARRFADTADGSATLNGLTFIGRLLIGSLVTLLAMDNLGIDITALITGLGIGGVAVALAVQNILGDLFSSLTIIFDRPFVVGDQINVDTFSGTVEHIGLKTTRVRSISGEQLIFSNSDLLKSRIRNHKRMHERRVTFTLAVAYTTTHEQLSALPSLLREIITAQPHARFERAHFKTYGDFALLFEVVYFVTVPDYRIYMDTQQAINLALFQQLQQQGIALAHTIAPTPAPPAARS